MGAARWFANDAEIRRDGVVVANSSSNMHGENCIARTIIGSAKPDLRHDAFAPATSIRARQIFRKRRVAFREEASVSGDTSESQFTSMSASPPRRPTTTPFGDGQDDRTDRRVKYSET